MSDTRIVGDNIESHWLRPREETDARLCLLFIFAHPDDETFGCGGTLARYAAQGFAVHCLCATRGEYGTVPPDELGNQSIATLRTTEMLCAAQVLGLHSVHFLG